VSAAKKWVRLPTRNGDEVDAHLALPPSGSGPGVLLLQEALGVNDYVRGVADRLAAQGYVVLAPDVYWRHERKVDLAHDEAGLGRAFELMGRLDRDVTSADLRDALRHLRGMPDVGDAKVGVIGFCMGGALTYRVACDADPDCAVSYYGVGIDAELERAASLECPILFHFGADDAFIPLDATMRVNDALGARPGVAIEVHEGAGHAFDNPGAPWHDAEVAARAWDRTTAFLAEHLGAD
jgi:carboxymethylenebutenolidase